MDMKDIQLSLSARGNRTKNIKRHCSFLISHLKYHTNLKNLDISNIADVYGSVDIPSPLWGGRIQNGRSDLCRIDVYWLYDNNIGIKLTISATDFTDDQYKSSSMLLKTFNRKGNTVIVSNKDLAKRIKNDYPNYNIEASSIMNINSLKKLDFNIYDSIVPPISSNDNIDFLKSIPTEYRKRITLFANVDCSYTCPAKICYKTMQKVNLTNDDSHFKCSHLDHKLPRTFYNDDKDWLNFYFDIDTLYSIGYKKYKILTSDPTYTHIDFLYKKKPEILY